VPTKLSRHPDAISAASAPEAAGSSWSRLARSLSEELQAPVGLIDLADQAWLEGPGASWQPEPTAACRIVEVGGRNEAETFVWTEPGGPKWLGLPVNLDGRGVVWALAAFRPDAAGVDPVGEDPRVVVWGPTCPDPALAAWGRTVVERMDREATARIRIRREAGEEAAPEPTHARRSTPLLVELIRRLRISDPSDRYQLMATRALRDEMGVAAVAWVPASRREPVVVGGAVPDLTSEDYRELVATSSGELISFHARPTAAGPRSVAIVADAVPEPTGWIVAVGHGADRALGPADAEPMRSVAGLLVAQRSNARLFAELKDLVFGIVRALTSAIDAKDKYTAGHSERVARMAVRLGEAMGLSASQRSDLYLMGLLHDVGKIGIDDDVLKKPDRLTRDEYRQIQKHVEIGVQILNDLKKLHHVLPGVLHHHESYDGSGYPSGLAGEAIPLTARILAVADSYDAMGSTRPYRRGMESSQIARIFAEGRGKQWDPVIVDALFACRDDLDAIRSKGIGRSLMAAVDDTLDRTAAQVAAG
jgi:HD-GYP domain-containing protein (c-di-GMP phosphodiesterase class II)